MCTGLEHSNRDTARPWPAILLLLLATACGGEQTNGADTQDRPPVITEFDALTLSPGATTHAGSEVSLSSIRAVALVGDSAFIAARGTVGGAIAPVGDTGGTAAGTTQDTVGAAPDTDGSAASPGAEAPGGPIRDDANTRLLVIVRGDSPPQPLGAPSPADADTSVAATPSDVIVPEAGDLVSIHGRVGVGSLDEVNEQFGIDLRQIGYEDGDIVFVVADRVIPQASR